MDEEIRVNVVGTMWPARSYDVRWVKDVWVATCPELPKMCGLGDTPEAAIREIQHVKDEIARAVRCYISNVEEADDV